MWTDECKRSISLPSFGYMRACLTISDQVHVRLCVFHYILVFFWPTTTTQESTFLVCTCIRRRARRESEIAFAHDNIHWHTHTDIFYKHFLLSKSIPWKKTRQTSENSCCCCQHQPDIHTSKETKKKTTTTTKTLSQEDEMRSKSGYQCLFRR